VIAEDTSFTFTAEFAGIDHFDAGEGAPHQGMISAMKTGMISASMKKGLKTQLMIKSNSRANNVFSKILNQFCVRFQKDNVIDARRKADFIKNLIPNAPPLTEDEEEMIEESMKFVEDVTSRAKRIAGTVNESVEKFLYRDGDGGAAWGMTVVKMDVAAITLFTEIWLLDTYARWAEHKKTTIRKVWENIDGTRSVEYICSLSLPGVQDRIFHTWLTWKRLIGEDRRETFIAVHGVPRSDLP